MTKPQDHALWITFQEWANDNGIELDRTEIDWEHWWECFLAGARGFIQTQSKHI